MADKNINSLHKFKPPPPNNKDKGRMVCKTAETQNKIHITNPV